MYIGSDYYDRNQIIELAKSAILTVTFVKANNQIRVLKGTLMPKYLPMQIDLEENLNKAKYTENLNVIALWDIEADGWRSFRLTSVTGVAITHEN